MHTKIGIVRDITTGEIRRIIIPDEDWQLDSHGVNCDEKIDIETHTGLIGMPEIKAIIKRRTGKILS